MAKRHIYQPITYPQQIILGYRLAMNRTIAEFPQHNFIANDLLILVACKDCQSSNDWIDKPMIKNHLKSYGLNYQNDNAYNKRFNKLVKSGFLKKLGGRAFYTTQKFVTCLSIEYVLRRLSTHFNQSSKPSDQLV